MEKVNMYLEEFVDEAVFESEKKIQAPVYSPQNDSSSMFFQTYESLLVSINVQGEKLNHPLLAFSHHWDVSTDENSVFDSLLAISSYSSEFKVLSGVANGIEVTVDLETYDNADTEAVGDGLTFVIENQEDFPLPELNGFDLEPGKAVNILVHPNLYTISEEALANFDYIDRKCVGKDELDLQYFETYGLTNCLVSAVFTEVFENCPFEDESDLFTG